MPTTFLYRSLGAGLGATLLLACGNDGETTVSAGNTESTTNFTNPSSSSTSEGPDPTGGHTTGTGGSMGNVHFDGAGSFDSKVQFR